MPMLFHHKLQFISGDLTASEQKVAAYIDEHRESVRGMSSSALAEVSGVSQIGRASCRERVFYSV